MFLLTGASTFLTTHSWAGGYYLLLRPCKNATTYQDFCDTRKYEKNFPLRSRHHLKTSVRQIYNVVWPENSVFLLSRVPTSATNGSTVTNHIPFTVRLPQILISTSWKKKKKFLRLLHPAQHDDSVVQMAGYSLRGYNHPVRFTKIIRWIRV